MSDWCAHQGIDKDYFLSHSHGQVHPFLSFNTDAETPLSHTLYRVRTQDNLRRFQKLPIPGSDMTDEELDDAVKLMEFTIAENGRKLKEQGGRGIERLPGVTELLDKLREGNARWGICTSG